MLRKPTRQERTVLTQMESIDALKHSVIGPPRYRLTNANVYVSPGGYHYIRYTDRVDECPSQIDESKLTTEQIEYIEHLLQSNLERFYKQAKVVRTYTSLRDKKVLDIGCGGGLFLSMLRKDGAIATGVELSDARAQYAKTKYSLEIVKRPIEADYWREYHSTFDVVTLWDVIEHVNYPLATMRACSEVLKTGGLMFIDTPCRDSFYHQVGELTYKLTNGRYPTFLNAMYSAHEFGHKQIFSTHEMRALLGEANFKVLELRTFHELSFPYGFYLTKILKSALLAKALAPLVSVLLAVFPVRNKMLVVGRKR